METLPPLTVERLSIADVDVISVSATQEQI